MPKFLDGYQTNLGSRFNLHKLSDTLHEALIRDNLFASSLDVKKVGSIYPVFITALQDSEEKIPLFPHPYFLTTRSEGKRVLATDMRMYMKKHVFDGTLASLPGAIAHLIEYNFTRSRAILNLEWIENDVETLKSNLWFSTMMFGRWLADVLSKAFALDMRDQQIIAIVASYYYQSLFTNEAKPEGETFEKWVIHGVKATFSEAKLVEEIYKKMPEVTKIDSLVEAIKLATGNVRLQNLEVLSLLTLVKNSWYGTNAKEIISISLEHPPTWMAVVYAALSERSYRSSTIYRIAERVGKGGKADEYLRQYREVIERHNLSQTHHSLAHAGLV